MLYHQKYHFCSQIRPLLYANISLQPWKEVHKKTLHRLLGSSNYSLFVAKPSIWQPQIELRYCKISPQSGQIFLTYKTLITSSCHRHFVQQNLFFHSQWSLISTNKMSKFTQLTIMCLCGCFFKQSWADLWTQPEIVGVDFRTRAEIGTPTL